MIDRIACWTTMLLATTAFLVLTRSGVAGPADEAAKPPAREIRFYRDHTMRFIDAEEAAKFLAAEDDFLSGLSRFDLQSRLQSTKEVTKADYLAMTAEQLLDWNSDEITRLSELVAELKPRLERFDLPFPDEVLLIKYSGEGESGAAYTRMNGIVFPKNRLAASAAMQEHLMLHELFHVLSRNDARLRRELYSIIGFQPCNPIRLPESLADLKISNPDAPTIDYYITLKETDEQAKQTVRHAVPVLLAIQEFDPQVGKNFFEYMQFQLLEIEQVDDRWRPLLIEDKPLLLDAASNEAYLKQIGRNTNYIIHPDEILADNFSFLVLELEDLPSPEILTQMGKRLLKE